MQLRRSLCSAFTLAILASAGFAQTTWWVHAGAAPGGSGSWWAPFQTIQQGIVAASHGDTVHVRPGTYFENIDFLGKSITVFASDGPSYTVIHGDESASVVRMSGIQPVLEGFTVENGSGTWLGTSYGGGILFDGADQALVLRCVVRENYAIKGDGIALYSGTASVLDTTIEDNGGPWFPYWCLTDDEGGGAYGRTPGLVLDGCTLRRNQATIHGGGANGVSLFHCAVTENVSAEGAGVSHVYAFATSIEDNDARSCDASYAAAGGAEFSTLESCSIERNEAWDDAGGARNSTLRFCSIRDNVVTSPIVAPAHGGGAWECVMEDCRVENNSIAYGPWAQPGSGGGAFAGTALRTVFRGNSASQGAGVYGTGLDRCVVWGNAGTGVVLDQAVASSIIRANGGIEILGGGTVAYCDVEGGFAGVGNIDADPLFWDAASGDFHLQPASPCIDAGDPSQTDPDGSRADMGTFPYDANECLAPVVYCPGGVSSNGCAPAIATWGLSKLSWSSGFEIRATSLPGERFASVIYGVSGAIQAPWGTSWSCVAPPRQRTGVAYAGGTSGACDGSIALDFNAWRTAHPFALGAPFAAGDVVWAQVWYRDAGVAPGTNFTEAVRFLTCP